jgi:hypothetical protein
MSDLQTIIDNATSIQIIRNKLAGQTITRSGLIRIGSVASYTPFQFIVDFKAGLRYSEHRELAEEINRLDRVFTSTINIGSSNPGLAYITRYLGEFTPAQIAQIDVDSYSGLNLVLDMTNVTGEFSTDVVFRPGDLLQLDNGYKYPYVVTSTVLRGTGSTITVPLHRPFKAQTGYSVSGKGIVVGSDVTWQVVMTKKPAVEIVPYDLLTFSSEFELAEVVED